MITHKPAYRNPDLTRKPKTQNKEMEFRYFTSSNFDSLRQLKYCK